MKAHAYGALVWRYSSTTYPTKAQAIAAMQAASSWDSVLNREAGIVGMSSSQTTYKYVAPPTSPNYSPWEYGAFGSDNQYHWFSSESDAVAFETSVLLASQEASTGGLCTSLSIAPSGNWTPEQPPPPYGSNGDSTIYTVNGQGYGVNPTPHCFDSSSITELLRRRTISCPAHYLISSQAPYCFDSDFDYIYSQPCRCGESAAPGTSTFVGNPCNVATADKFQTETDYSSNTLTLTRSYHSATLESFQGVGVGWSLSYGDRAIIAAGQAYGLIRPDGHHDPLIYWNGISYSTSDDTLHVQQTGSNWTAILGDGSQEVYDANGTLIQLINAAGQITTLSYNAGVLSAVTDAFGHALQFTYTNGRLTQVTDPAGKTIAYAYDSNGNLTSVAYPDGTSKTYLYENASLPNHLTGIVDESTSRFATFGYDSTGRAIHTEHAGGAEGASITYGNGVATVSDGTGGTTTYTFTTDANYSQLPVSIAHGSNVRSYVVPPPSQDSLRRVTQMTDENGHVTSYTYGDHLASKTEAVGTANARTTSYQYVSTLLALPTLVTERLRTTAYGYYPGTNLVQTKTLTDTTVTPNISRTWGYTYDSYGRVLTVDGPRTDVSDVTSYTYYTCTTGFQCGQLQTVTNAAGQTTTYNTYNAHGQPLTITDPNGVVTTLTYDLRQRLTSRQVGSETSTFDYWPTGLLKKVTLPDGSYLLYQYDAAHRLTQVSDGLGNSIDYTLDAMGNRTAENVYDPSNTLHRTHTRVFNTLNELYQDVNAAGTAAVTTTFGYDPQGNQTSIAAPLARNTGNLYDELNRLKQITDPTNGITAFGYDANDNLTSVVDPRSLTTAYTYNGFGDLVTQMSPDTGATTNTYDSAGNLATSTDPRGAISTYTYDALNRVTSVVYALGGTTDQTITFTYDTSANGKGHLTGASDANHSLSWSYDGQGRVTNKTQIVNGVTQSVGYSHTNANLTSLVTPSGQTIAYGYNGNHQVTSVAVNGTTVLNTVTYEPLGPVNGWTWGNGTTTTRTYDTDGKITQIVSAGTKTYGYDDAFRITGISDTSPGAANWTYNYDALDRITSGTNPSITRGWTYDANGNRLTETGTAPSTYTIFPSSNRITSVSGTLARTYGYDASGNTTSYAGVTATYNNAGRLKTLSYGGSTETLIYNALGQRVEKTGGSGGTVLYAYDEGGHLLGEYDGTGALVQETVWLGDIPVATLRPNGSGISIYYVHTDQLNTPRAITRPADNVLMWTWSSDPFGTDAANANPAGAGTFTYNLRFAGQVFDGPAGLHYNGFRDYDPAVGRYVESDPAGLAASINTYAYVDSDPLLFFDPDGLGKEGGQKSIGGDDPAMPRSINKNSSPAEVKQALNKAKEILKTPGINPARASRIRGWIKWVQRGFTRSISCPPLLDQLALETARELCGAGDQTMCQVFQMLGGEIDVPGT